jgi:hypothetical protein
MSLREKAFYSQVAARGAPRGESEGAGAREALSQAVLRPSAAAEGAPVAGLRARAAGERHR